MSVTVTVAGKDVSDRLRPSSLHQALFGHTQTQLVLTRALNARDLRQEAEDLLGKPYEITFRNGKASSAKFQGRIYGMTGAESLIQLQGYGLGRAMDEVARTRSFTRKSAKEVVQRVLGDSGVAHAISNYQKSVEFDYLVQYDETDLAFVRRLLAYDGMMIYDEGTRLRVVSSLSGSKAIKLAAQEMVDWPGAVAFNLAPVAARAVSQSYLPQRKNEALQQQATAASGSQWHSLAVAKHNEVFRGVEKRVHNRPIMNPSQLRDHLEGRARMLSGGLFHFEARISRPGLFAGSTLDLEGHPFISEKLAVSSISIDFDRAHYECRIQAVPPSAALDTNRDARPFEAFETAEVTDNKDPEALGRVRVRFLWDQVGDALPWVRIVQPGAGSKRGTSWTPAAGDEVLVGYEYGDPSRPVILGACYHSKAKPDFKTKNGSEEILLARTERGTEVRLIDTPGKEEVIVLTEAGGGKNEIRLRAGRVPEMILKSTGKVRIEGETIEISAKRSMKLDAKDASVTGRSNLKMNGQRTIVTGSSTMGVRGNMVAVKGTSVKIN